MFTPNNYAVYYVNGNITQSGSNLKQSKPDLTWIKFSAAPSEQNVINKNEDVWITFQTSNLILGPGSNQFTFTPDSTILNQTSILGGLPISILTVSLEDVPTTGTTISQQDQDLILTVDSVNEPDWFDWIDNESSDEEEEPASINLHIRPTLAGPKSRKHVPGYYLHYHVSEHLH